MSGAEQAELERRVHDACRRAVALAVREFPALAAGDAEDELLEEVTLRVVQRWAEVAEAFRGSDVDVRRKTGWLYKVAHTKALDVLGRRSRRREIAAPVPVDAVVSPAAPGWSQVARAERFAIVVRWLADDFLALLRLVPDDRLPDPAADPAGWLDVWGVDRAHLLTLAAACDRQYGPGPGDVDGLGQWSEALRLALLLELARAAGSALGAADNRALHTARRHPVEGLAASSIPPLLVTDQTVSDARRRCFDILRRAWGPGAAEAGA